MTSDCDVGMKPMSSSYSLASVEEESIQMSNYNAHMYELQKRRSGNPDDTIVVDIQYSNMKTEMEANASQAAAYAIITFCTEQEIARHLKELFDKEYGATWQCICGRHFGSYVTFWPKNFIYFRIGSVSFILFKTIAIVDAPSSSIS